MSTARTRKKATPKKDGQLADVAKTARIIGEDGNVTLSLKSGLKVTVYKCKAKNVGTVLEFLTFVMEEMGIKNLGDVPKISNDAGFFLQLISKGADRMFIVAAELCSLSYEEFVELELDDTIKVVMEVVDLNKDFFLQSVLPLVPFALQDVPANKTNQSS